MTQNPLNPDEQNTDEPAATPVEEPAEQPTFEAPEPTFEAPEPAATEPTHAAPDAEPADDAPAAPAAPADEPAAAQPTFAAPADAQPGTPPPPPFGAPAQPGPAPYGAPGQGQAPYGAPNPGQQSYGAPNQQFFQGSEYNTPVGGAKSKIVAGILGILLGALGIHNFYLGYMKKAIIQLLITVVSIGLLSWVSAIWGLIEGILILISKPGEQWHRDARGVELTD